MILPEVPGMRRCRCGCRGGCSTGPRTPRGEIEACRHRSGRSMIRARIAVLPEATRMKSDPVVRNRIRACHVGAMLCLGAIGLLQAKDPDKGLRFSSPQVLDLSSSAKV